jgi:activator of HSP90 ATPase
MPDFKKYYSIPASPQEIYAALTNPTIIRLWTGEPAEMSTEPGSEFSLWDGSIAGKNLEFEQDKKIVQEWYFGDRPEQSVVTIKLHPAKDGTSVELRHTNIPEEDFDEITSGWTESYFASVYEFFE